MLELSAPRVFPAVGDLRASGCGGEAHGLRARCPVASRGSVPRRPRPARVEPPSEAGFVLVLGLTVCLFSLSKHVGLCSRVLGVFGSLG